MVVIGLLGGISLIVMNLTKQSTQSSTKYQFDSEILLITNEINGILSDPNKCLTTFTNATQAASPALPILNATPSNVTSPSGIAGIPSTVRKYTLTGGPYGNGEVKITSYSLNLSATPDPLLTINFQKKKILGTGITPKTIRLHVVKNGLGVITMCRSISTASIDIWSRGTNSDIFYNGGNVGIGTATPTASLEVAGGIKPGDQTQVTICDASKEGTQRYNKLAHAMEYCGYNSGPPVTYSWMPIGGASGINSCIIANSGVSWNTATATCPVGYTMTGGGCDSVPQTGHFRSHYPNSGNSFFCWDYTSQNVIAYAICCK